MLLILMTTIVNSPFSSFLAPEKFQRPRNLVEAQSRMELNMMYFLTNYLIICVLFFTIAMYVFAILPSYHHCVTRYGDQ
jgi:hypothetical protein